MEPGGQSPTARAARHPGGHGDPVSHRLLIDSDRLERADLREVFARQNDRELRARVELTFALLLFFLGGANLLEGLNAPSRIELIVATYGFTALICIVGIALGRMRSLSLRPAPLALGCLAAVSIATNLYGILVHVQAERLAMAQVTLLTSLTVLLPWGWRPQLALSLTASVSYAIAAPYLQTADSIGFSLIVLVVAATVSTVGALFLGSYRETMFVRSALLQEEADVAAALAHVGETLSVNLDQPDLLKRVNQLSLTLLECDWSSIFFWNARNEAQLASNAGSPPEVREYLEKLLLPVDSLPLLSALRPGETLEIADADHQDLVPVELLRRLQVSSAIHAAITRGGRVVGLLTNGYSERTGPFSPKQRRLALGIAHAAAIALENARLITDLTAASHLKTEFVATMSHELRTPLNVIMGYTELLSELEFGPLTSTQAAAIASTRQSAHELLELVNATLDLNRLDAGRDPLALSDVDIAALFSELERELAPLRMRTIDVHWRNLAGAEPLASDRAKLKTILKNLVGNALKFTDRGQVVVEARRDAGGLEIVVQDTGIGIPADQLSVVFEVFRQGDGSSTRRYGGVGLGLHIVQRLVGTLGGTISVESTEGVGSTFTVRLPEPPADAQATGT